MRMAKQCSRLECLRRQIQCLSNEIASLNFSRSAPTTFTTCIGVFFPEPPAWKDSESQCFLQTSFKNPLCNICTGAFSRICKSSKNKQFFNPKETQQQVTSHAILFSTIILVQIISLCQIIQDFKRKNIFQIICTGARLRKLLVGTMHLH